MLVLHQLLSRRLEQINEQAKLIEQRLLELETTGQALDDLKGLKGGEEILIPMGSGCYTYGRAGDSGRLLCDVGAGVMVSKSPGEAKKILEDKEAGIGSFSKALQKEANDAVEKMNEIGPELQRFLQESQGKRQEPEGGG